MERLITKLRGFFKELRRRNVFKVASVYAVTAWGASMGASSLFPAFGAPPSAVPLFVGVAVLGFPIAVALAWAYELRSPGHMPGSGGQLLLDRGAGEGTEFLMLHPSAVRVAWEDGRGRHDRSFAHNFRIGREASCDVHLDDPLISRRHAAVVYDQGLWWVTDLESRNGTLLDGKRVARAPLPSHCELMLHEHAAPIRLDIVATPDARTVTSSRIHLTNE